MADWTDEEYTVAADHVDQKAEASPLDGWDDSVAAVAIVLQCEVTALRVALEECRSILVDDCEYEEDYASVIAIDAVLTRIPK
jgi:hypothetical protein